MISSSAEMKVMRRCKVSRRGAFASSFLELSKVGPVLGRHLKSYLATRLVITRRQIPQAAPTVLSSAILTIWFVLSLQFIARPLPNTRAWWRFAGHVDEATGKLAVHLLEWHTEERKAIGSLIEARIISRMTLRTSLVPCIFLPRHKIPGTQS